MRKPARSKVVDDIEVESSSSNLFRKTRGSGNPIVLLHGAFTTHFDWPETITAPLAKIGQVIAVDRPGHGHSPRRRFDGDAKAQARQISSALALDRPAVVVGHSFGALPALAWAELFPDQVAGLILIAPVCFPEWRAEQLILGPRALPFIGPGFSMAANLILDRLCLKLIQRMMFAPQQVPPEWLEQYPTDQIISPASFAHEGEDAISSSPLGFGAYRRDPPKQPLSLIQGDSDGVVVGGWHARAMHQLAPSSTMIWLKGVGHMAHHAAPERVVEQIVRYL